MGKLLLLELFCKRCKDSFFTMVKVKNLPKKEQEEVKKTVHKKTRSNKFKYRTHIKRLCKDLNIPRVNKDGSQFMDESVQSFIDGLLRHMSVMLADTNKTLTQKTARLAFASYMENLGAPEELLKAALAKSDKAMEKLEKSLIKK